MGLPIVIVDLLLVSSYKDSEVTDENLYKKSTLELQRDEEVKNLINSRMNDK